MCVHARAYVYLYIHSLSLGGSKAAGKTEEWLPRVDQGVALGHWPDGCTILYTLLCSVLLL